MALKRRRFEDLGAACLYESVFGDVALGDMLSARLRILDDLAGEGCGPASDLAARRAFLADPLLLATSPWARLARFVKAFSLEEYTALRVYIRSDKMSPCNSRMER